MKNPFKMLTGFFCDRKCVKSKMATMNASDRARAFTLMFDLKVTEIHIMCLKVVSEGEEFKLTKSSYFLSLQMHQNRRQEQD